MNEEDLKQLIRKMGGEPPSRIVVQQRTHIDIDPRIMTAIAGACNKMICPTCGIEIPCRVTLGKQVVVEHRCGSCDYKLGMRVKV